MNSKFRPYLVRLLIVSAISLVFVAIFNEVAYSFQREKYDRLPHTQQLVIPAGTAQRVAAGEEAPGIPADMIFVIGDTLEVVNQDDTPHQLGPIWVPPGGTGKLLLQEADKFAFACSFRPSQYISMDVRQATTLETRLTALMLAGPTTTAFLFIYSLLIFPLDKKPGNKPGNKPPAPAETATPAGGS